MKQAYSEMTLLEFQDRFATEEACRQHLIAMRWPDGFVCPKRESRRHCFSANRGEYHCYSCDGVTSPTAGTLFHCSKIPLKKWFWGIFLVATSKKGVPALYLKRQLQVHYRTAWMMLRKIRLAMANRDDHWELSGIIQADEIFVGGKETMQEKREDSNKTAFFIAVSESSNGKPEFAKIKKLESAYDGVSLCAVAEKLIPTGSKLKTDGKGYYRRFALKKQCEHEYVVAMKHPEKAHKHLHWVNILTSNLKRWLLSTHHGIGPRYREEYAAEFVYRFNRRKWPNQAFDRLLFANISKGATPLRGSRA
jgi:hypothetical protein